MIKIKERKIKPFLLKTTYRLYKIFIETKYKMVGNNDIVKRISYIFYINRKKMFKLTPPNRMHPHFQEKLKRKKKIKFSFVKSSSTYLLYYVVIIVII